MKPCIFVHYGYSDYLDSVFAITRRYNPNNRMILLGDDSNKEVAEKYNIEFYHFSLYNQSIPYYHFSTNPEIYEKFCFERWFIIKNFCLEANISEILYSDSDNAFFVDFNTLKYTNARIGKWYRHVVPNVFFVTTEYLVQICNYYLELFSLPKESFINEIKCVCNLKDGIPELYTDMYFLQHAINKLRLRFKPLPQDINANINNYEIIIRDNKIYQKGTDIQILNIHFCANNKSLAKETLQYLNTVPVKVTKNPTQLFLKYK
jgi:hypothetical protein